MKTSQLPLIDILRPFAGAIIGTLLIVVVLSFRLGTVGPGVGITEAATVEAVQGRTLGMRHILQENPLFLPHSLGMYALEKTGLTSLTAIRAVGVSFGVIAVISFYLILKHWHTRRVAILGSILFLTSGGLLHAARLAVPETTYFLIVPLMYLGIKLQQGKRPFIVLTLSILLSVFLLYVPGLIWLIVPIGIWQRRRLVEQARETNTLVLSAVIILGLLALAPLCYALVSKPGLWQQWLGYNRPFSSLLETAKNFGLVPVHIFAKGPANAILNVGRLPLFDIATSALVILGGYWYFFKRGLDRSKFLVAGLLFGALLITVYGEAARPVLLPFLYLMVAAGITLMLQQWFTVFPRNPLARGIALSLMTLLVMAIGYYHLQRYFVAWPNATETKAVFTPKT